MRHFSVSALTLLASTLVSCSPVPQESTENAIDDGVILNYALTLEYLERAFYLEGLKNYTQEDFVAAGFEDPFYSNLERIAGDEITHVDFLAAALEQAGITATVELEYCFPSVDAKSFVTLSSVLEGVGVSAYIGAAGSIVNKDYLTVAGTILGIEARHASYIRAALGQVPFPNSFETPLDFVSPSLLPIAAFEYCLTGHRSELGLLPRGPFHLRWHQPSHPTLQSVPRVGRQGLLGSSEGW